MSVGVTKGYRDSKSTFCTPKKYYILRKIIAEWEIIL